MPKISFAHFSILKYSDIQQIARSVRNYSRKQPRNTTLSSTVSKIIRSVRDKGDSALLSLGSEFEGTHLSRPDELFVKEDEIRRAYSKLTSRQVESMKLAYRQIRWLARNQMKRYRPASYRTPLGFIINERFEPIERVGGYIPGGLAAYPSTVLMICVPSKESAVKNIVLATPPRRDGTVNESTLVAAHICGIKEIIKVGGAQAIAALAFGTRSIRKVDLIAGPGNQYVTEAKRQVSAIGAVSIDMLAGPTELLIIADHDANPKFIAEDLVSQAEHGNRTICGVVSDSAELISRIQSLVISATDRSRIDYIAQSFFFSVKTRSSDDAMRFAQEFSPEHLEVLLSIEELTTRKRIERNLTKAGLVLMGEFAPCSATDYIVGTNHILPTGGLAARAAGVSVETFLKRVTTVHSSRPALHQSLKALSDVAYLEGLPNHSLAAQARFR